ncbi:MULTISPECIES: hypothetical protein [unclassified Streptomyces]|uniref:hypothetical protein n=1 Tax=unclassified Streptomyces TaxID=2593676 RepID=UPI0023670298|nr:MULTISPECIES: hypothetical protein [unclassified Streptomyces]MDF3147838.1 hypothetical protein [Streptomyces sp. T21Q-yed]WDF37549.1 hypothetical protein PBV52_12440 [Streptomyces sp. T12]
MSSSNNNSNNSSNNSHRRVRVWTVVCAVATVVLGPAAVTASALDQANKAPMYHAVKAEPTQAYIPSDPSRRRAMA